MMSSPKVLLLNHCTKYLNDDPVHLSSMTLEELDGDDETTLLLNQFTPFVERHFVEILPCKGEIVCLAAENKFYVCNPSTREFAFLPDPSPSISRDPDSAFGYIPSMNEYKLVHLYTDQYNIIGCEMFTISDGEEVGTRSWRVIREKCPCPVQGHGVMVANVFYWITFHEDETIRKSIISFDLETETFGIMAGPPQGCGEVMDMVEQVELEGSLCVVDNFSQHSTMVIWMLKDDYGNNNQHVWEIKYRIYVPCDDLFGVVPVYDRDGEIILYDRKKSIYYYDIETGKVRRVANGIISRMELAIYTDGFFSLGK